MKSTDSSEEQFNMLAGCLLHAGFLLGLLFSPDDGEDMFFRNVG
jgi:hypothetical protein